MPRQQSHDRDGTDHHSRTPMVIDQRGCERRWLRISRRHRRDTQPLARHLDLPKWTTYVRAREQSQPAGTAS